MTKATFNIGDIVKCISAGYVYSTYPEMRQKLGIKGAKTIGPLRNGNKYIVKNFHFYNGKEYYYITDLETEKAEILIAPGGLSKCKIQFKSKLYEIY